MKPSTFLPYTAFWLAVLQLLLANPRAQAFVPSPSLFTTNGSRGPHKTNNRIVLRDTAADTLQAEEVTPSSTRTKVTLSFPPFSDIMDVRPGECLSSEPFLCQGDHRFRVKLYPRGGGGDSSRSRPQDLVGLYLEYLGRFDGGDDASVDATFALRLKGRQQEQKRFDVEWRAGMRFVSNPKESNLKQGCATEFGDPVMQTGLLREFLGAQNQNTALDPVFIEAEVLIHDTPLEESLVLNSSSSSSSPTEDSSASSFNNNKDIRLRDDGITCAHDTERVRVGKVVVPVLSGLSQRPKMFEQGSYPGVEYRILRILKDGEDRFTSCPGAEYELKPVYPLVQQLERQWPVRVKEESIPKLFTPSMYNILSAFGSLFTAASGLFAAFLLSQAISLFFIPSKSMDPTLRVGDVLLVDKVSSRTPFHKNRVDDIVLFSPPSALQEIVAKNGGNLKSRDLFVKRIAAAPGDKVTVYKDGKVEINDQDVVEGRRDLCEAEPLRLIEKYIEPKEDRIIDPKEVFVMGDCSSVSVDSRVWGPLEADKIVGRPIVRLWPLDRFGKVE